MLLDWQWREKDRGAHGQPMSESTSPLANPINPDGQWTYQSGAPLVDYAEKARRDAEDEYRKQYDKVPNGLIFPVTKVSRQPAE